MLLALASNTIHMRLLYPLGGPFCLTFSSQEVLAKAADVRARAQRWPSRPSTG